MDKGENHRYGFTDLRHYYYLGDRISGTTTHNAQQQHYGMIQPVGDHDHITPELILATQSTSTTPSTSAAAATTTSTAAAAAGAPPFQPPPPPHLTKINATSSSDEPQQQNAFGGTLHENGGCEINPQGRWPRQETLTLLEVRSRLDPKFKGSAHKTPLWDEVSRIMAEEHGYQRSGKKCREKLENLYKYYKKTKEGRAGRQDGKHYRFFRQLDALYGENHTTAAGAAPHIHMSSNGVDHSAASAAAAKLVGRQRRPTSTNNYYDHNNNNNVSLNSAHDQQRSSETLMFSSSSEEDDVGRKGKQQQGKRSWKAKIKELVDHQVKRFMDAQETWLERMLKTMESKESERFSREEEWRRREAEIVERERRNWANERAWMQARDAVLIQALEKVIRGRSSCIGNGGETTTFLLPSEDLACVDIHDRDSEQCWGDKDRSSWSEPEFTSLMKLREGMRWGFGDDKWDGISAGTSEMGYERSAGMCKEKWEDMHSCLWKIKRLKNNDVDDDMEKRHLVGRRRCVHEAEHGGAINPEPSPTSTSNAASDDGCLRFLIEGGTLWDQHQAVDEEEEEEEEEEEDRSGES